MHVLWFQMIMNITEDNYQNDKDRYNNQNTADRYTDHDSSDRV